MDNIQTTVKDLHPLEVRVLQGFTSGDELSAEKLDSSLEGFKTGNGNQALSWLAAKGLVAEKRRETHVFYELTDAGRKQQAQGTGEERIIELLRIQPGLKMPEIASTLKLEQKDIGSAYGQLSKLGVLGMNGDKGVIIALKPEDLDTNGRPAKGKGAAHLALVRGLLDKAAAQTSLSEADLSPEEKSAMSGLAKKRGAGDSAFHIVERETVIYNFTPEAGPVIKALNAQGLTGAEENELTAAMLADGSWQGKRFRAYNVKTAPVRLIPGRTNPYVQFLEDVKDKLAGLGFEEFDGPLIETEFWNSDALFMPQFHAARDIHDVYRIAPPPNAAGEDKNGFLHAKAIQEPWLDNVAKAHENGGSTGSTGWRYNFDREFTRRLILRSQGTTLSAQTLPHAKVPGKYFGIVRCFRYDQVDATHLSDFYQTEGIVLGEDVNLRTLLGMLEMFAVEVAGAKEIKYVPGYFPFTEPSVEVHIKHPTLGWFELGGSGIFRPEVTESLGVHVPVAAWGIGIDRMALMALGISNIRELFSYDIENIRLRKTKGAQQNA